MAKRLDRETLAEDQDLCRSLLKLNNDNAVALSWLDNDGLAHLVGEAFVCLCYPPSDALLIAFDENADYDSPNYRWFCDRFDRFVYVDRIVVCQSARGGGLARALYEHLFELARDVGHKRIVCEVNADPPNPASDAFHENLGFRTIGRATLENGKAVRYFEHLLD